MNMNYKILLTVIITSLFSIQLTADDKFSHEHDGVYHDLSLADVNIESDPVTNPEKQIQGHWILEKLETTDNQMMALMYAKGYEIWLDVDKSFLQVSVRLGSSDTAYQDPPLYFYIEEGIIHMDNKDFTIGYKDGMIILGMIGMDEAYRYTFKREDS